MNQNMKRNQKRKQPKSHLSLDVVASDNVANCPESSRNHTLRKRGMNTIVLHLSFIYLLIIHQKLNNSAAHSVVNHCLDLVIGT